jgi:YhcH/YjgK/YiaL family protein
MILARLEEADRYASLNPGFAKAFAFLRRSHLAQLAPGRHEIDGDRVYAMVIQAPGRTREAAKLEAHRKYIDVQYSVTATEEMGWKSTPACTRRDSDYDAEKEVELFADPPVAWIGVPPGHFVIFFPEDAHAPMIAEGNLHKVVVKVAV